MNKSLHSFCYPLCLCCAMWSSVALAQSTCPDGTSFAFDAKTKTMVCTPVEASQTTPRDMTTASQQQQIPSATVVHDPFVSRTAQTDPSTFVPKATSATSPPHSNIDTPHAPPIHKDVEGASHDNAPILPSPMSLLWKESIVATSVSILWSTATYYWFESLHTKYYYYDKWDRIYVSTGGEGRLRSQYSLSQVSLFLLNTTIYSTSIALTDYFVGGVPTWWHPVVGAASGAFLTWLLGTFSAAVNPDAEPWVTTVLTATLPLAGALLSNYFFRRSKYAPHIYDADGSNGDTNSSNGSTSRLHLVPLFATDGHVSVLGVAGSF